MKVLSLPGRNSGTEFIPLFCDGLERAGVTIVDVRSVRPWSFGIDIINIHFPAHYIAEKPIVYSLMRSALSLLFFYFAKNIWNSQIVYTVHDVVPFEPRHEWLLWPYLRAVHKLVDGYMFLSDSSKEEFLRRFADQHGKRWTRIDHGAFPVSPGDSTKPGRSALLGQVAGGLLVGFLGSIKAYKGVELLSSIPRELADGTSVRVVVAGSSPEPYRPVVERHLRQLGNQMIRVDRKLSNAELNEMLRSVDVVFMPYTRGWNSGMVMLALGMHARVVALRRPLFEELAAKLGEPWIYLFETDPASPESELKAVLERMSKQPIEQADIARLSEFLSERSFDRAGSLLRTFYGDLRASRLAAAV